MNRAFWRWIKKSLSFKKQKRRMRVENRFSRLGILEKSLSEIWAQAEEDSTRDGCTWENHFDDQGSEWPLMENVFWWVTH